LFFEKQNVILFKFSDKLYQNLKTRKMADLTPAADNWPKLTKGYLAMLEASLGNKYDVTVKQTKDGFWIVTVKFDDQKQYLPMTTARGDTKVWRNIIGAILFVQENCIQASRVFVEVGDWTLCRSDGVF
jgi:hypothetical protein